MDGLTELREAIDDERADPTPHMEWAVQEIERLRAQRDTMLLALSGPAALAVGAVCAVDPPEGQRLKAEIGAAIREACEPR